MYLYDTGAGDAYLIGTGAGDVYLTGAVYIGTTLLYLTEPGAGDMYLAGDSYLILLASLYDLESGYEEWT